MYKIGTIIIFHKVLFTVVREADPFGIGCVSNEFINEYQYPFKLYTDIFSEEE
jgi:hypothetical protein